MSVPFIQFHDVYRHFGGKEVLRGLSFEIGRGEIFALLGRNGSGKTTALKILLGFLEPHHGEARILGASSHTLSPDLRERIGYVGEGSRLYSTIRVQDHVAFEAATRKAFRRDFAEKAIDRCGLPRKSLVGVLSRGQRAQLALILAVSAEPDVLVFDDPAMGLDVVMRRELLDVMIDLLSEKGCGVLFSSHILTDVERIADRVGILHGGRLIVDATLSDVKTRLERRLWTGSSPGLAPPPVEALLVSRRRRDGQELLLLDAKPEDLATLSNGGARLSAPEPLSLEEAFLLLVTDGGEAGILPRSQEVSS
jgi:ABC-2 type transport system ATP-binding protein